MINSEQARTIILDAIEPVGTITVALQRALHHVLAETLVAHENIPPFDNSAMDGFAV